jgi:hypothetical protein
MGGMRWGRGFGSQEKGIKWLMEIKYLMDGIERI